MCKNIELPRGDLSNSSREYTTDLNLVGNIWRQNKCGQYIKDKRYLSQHPELKETISSVKQLINTIDQQKILTLSDFSNELEMKGLKIIKSHLHNIFKKVHIMCVVNHLNLH